MKEFGISFQKGDKFRINLRLFDKYNRELGRKSTSKGFSLGHYPYVVALADEFV